MAHAIVVITWLRFYVLSLLSLSCVASMAVPVTSCRRWRRDWITAWNSDKVRTCCTVAECLATILFWWLSSSVSSSSSVTVGFLTLSASIWILSMFSRSLRNRWPGGALREALYKKRKGETEAEREGERERRRSSPKALSRSLRGSPCLRAASCQKKHFILKRDIQDAEQRHKGSRAISPKVPPEKGGSTTHPLFETFQLRTSS